MIMHSASFFGSLLIDHSVTATYSSSISGRSQSVDTSEGRACVLVLVLLITVRGCVEPMGGAYYVYFLAGVCAAVAFATTALSKMLFKAPKVGADLFQ